MKKWIVITTINPPTPAIDKIAELCEKGWSAVVVGDTKTPPDWHKGGVDFFSVKDQKEMFGEFADLIPYRHYCRKNLGYLYAMSKGADVILETDDDNIPYSSFGTSIGRSVSGRVAKGNGWFNVYKHFTSENIWPRGLPLDEIHNAGELSNQEGKRDCLIQQFLADRDPDVDAIYRLVFKGDLFFDQSAKPIILEPGAWCPFNSQNTLFWKEAFPLLYLPCHVSFRMTDIWRSFVAQAALWASGQTLAFLPATVEQIRNPHDLTKDFEQEVIGFRENRRIGVILSEKAKAFQGTTPGVAAIAKSFWEALAEGGIVPAQERLIWEKWFKWFE